MREVIKSQLVIGDIDISQAKPNIKSRDEIDKIATGLIYIFTNPELRKAVFDCLERIVPSKVSKQNGRPGMNLWEIFVLAVFRNGCNIDYDKLENLANNHILIRQLLGHTKDSVWSNEHIYHLQTIKDNVSLIKDDIINDINILVVKTGHKLLTNKKKDELHCSVDSFVVETDVHYPTDINILFDAIRKATELSANFCYEHGLNDLRQSNHHLKQVKRLYRGVLKAKRGKRLDTIVERHQIYVTKIKTLVLKINQSLLKIKELVTLDLVDLEQLCVIDKYINYVYKQIDLIERRVFNNEKIPHSEKIFSIFESHTQWVSKGKLGKYVEFGVPVCIIKDQHGYILSYIIMHDVHDVDIAVSIVKDALDNYNNIESSSFDKGFWSPENLTKLKEILSKVILPKKGKVSKSQQAEYDEPNFKRLRKKHSAVESSINSLEYSGLDKCLDHGTHGFNKYIAMSILARNFQTLGNNLLKKETKSRKRKKTVRISKVA